ncbi:MAG: hypothetical protein ABIO91_03750 [Pyrinomonadaceae bacterium]
MEADKEVKQNEPDLFVRYSDEINKAYERAVREALLRHKQAGNPVAISREGKVVILQPDEIEID